MGGVVLRAGLEVLDDVSIGCEEGSGSCGVRWVLVQQQLRVQFWKLLCVCLASVDIQRGIYRLFGLQLARGAGQPTTHSAWPAGQPAGLAGNAGCSDIAPLVQEAQA